VMAKTSRVSKAPAKTNVVEMPPGQSGLRRADWRGWVDEEFLRDLRGQRAIKVYTDMATDAIVGACLGTIKSTLRNVKWSAQGGDDERKEFIESCFSDFNWGDALSEAFTMLDFGWSWLCPGYKRRSGSTNDPLTRSKFKDGKIGWSKWFPRSQDSFREWRWDERGELMAMVQQAPPTYAVTVIDLNRSLHFRTVSHKDNPEGISILRTAFRSWKFHKNGETIEAIGMERDLAGLPYIKRHPSLKGNDENYKEILRKIRRDENEGLLIDLLKDENGNDLIEFGLLASAGTRQFDSDKVIQRKAREIALAMHVDMILMGHEKVGSYSLADNKTSIYSLFVGSILDTVQRVINDNAIPRLLALNGMSVDDAPMWMPGDIESADLGVLGTFLTACVNAGMELFPDEDVDAYLRKAANLPAKSEETIRLQEERREENAQMLTAANEAKDMEIVTEDE
jgi:hypothetical protein